MARALDFIDANLQRGTIVSILIGATATLVLIIYAVAWRENLYITLVFVVVGLLGTWREYVVWQRRRQQRGLELIGARNELDE